ncbi:MAG: hypothetical protein K6G07_02825 [Lachnospiraceae bacterium]|nr:hypothetical protein [Lachnospiraceae bacterium]
MKRPNFIHVVKKEEFDKKKAKRAAYAGSAIFLATALTVSGMSFLPVSAAKTEEEITEEAEGETEDVSETEEILTQQLADTMGSGTSDADKEETVYVITDASGVVDETIVSDWLKNSDNKTKVNDATTLSCVTNVKGDETYEEEGDGAIVWDAEGKDIYYQGETDEKAPIDVKITYYLDGKEIAPGDLAGKNGKVKIRLDYTNNTNETMEVNGKTEEAKVPFTIVSGMILPVDHFSNVEVENGRVISDGSRNIVVGVAMPGLEETIDPEGKLKEKGDYSIPSYVEVTADATDFALDMTMSVAMSDVLGSFDLTGGIDAGSIEDSLDKLTDASDQLIDGTAELKDGTGKLLDGGTTLKNGIGTLQSGVGEYTNGVGQLSAGLGQLSSGSGQLSDGASQVSAGVNLLAGKLTGMSTKLNDAIAEQKANQDALAPTVEADKTSVTSEITSYATNIATASATAAAPVAAKVGASAVGSAVSNAAGSTDLANAVNAAVTSAAGGYAASYGASNAPSVAASAAAGSAASAAESALAAAQTDGTITATGIALENIPNYTNAVTNAVANAVATSVAQAIISDYTAGLAQTSATTASSTIQSSLSASLTEEALTAAVTAAMSSPETQAAIGNAAASAAQNVSAQGVSDAVTKLGTDAGNLGGAVGAQTALSTINGNMDLSQLNTLVQGAADLANGASTLNAGIQSANDGAAKLAGASGELNGGTAKLSDGAGQLVDGITQLDEGAGRLKEGMITFDEEGIKKITDALGDDAVAVVDRIQAVTDLGKEYNTFTRLADGQTGKVKFIIRSGSVK